MNNETWREMYTVQCTCATCIYCAAFMLLNK